MALLAAFELLAKAVGVNLLAVRYTGHVAYRRNLVRLVYVPDQLGELQNGALLVMDNGDVTDPLLDYLPGRPQYTQVPITTLSATLLANRFK